METICGPLDTKCGPQSSYYSSFITKDLFVQSIIGLWLSKIRSRVIERLYFVCEIRPSFWPQFIVYTARLATYQNWKQCNLMLGKHQKTMIVVVFLNVAHILDMWIPNISHIIHNPHVGHKEPINDCYDWVEGTIFSHVVGWSAVWNWL